MAQADAEGREPSTHDLIVELREAVGLFAGAMPITPKQAWEEAIERVRQMVERDVGRVEPGPFDDVECPVDGCDFVARAGSSSWTYHAFEKHPERIKRRPIVDGVIV